MITNLRTAFTNILAEVTWMDESTRKLAILKVCVITTLEIKMRLHA